MPTLHLSHQGGKLRLRTGRLVLTDPDGTVLHDVPARKVRRVVVHGKVALTTPALVFLLKNGASIHFVSLQGERYGVASSTGLPDPQRFVRQLTLPADEQLALAKAILSAKVRSQREYLRRSGVYQKYDALSGFLNKMGDARNLDELRGFEGMASRAYFGGIAGLLHEVGFYGRRRRPPTDPVNAALSYAYAVLLSLSISAILVAEAHPEIGIFHATGRRRPALALDLMEEFRVPVVDAPIIRAFKRGWLGRDDTRTDGRAVLLNTQGKKKVIEGLERRLSAQPANADSDYRSLVFKQAERLASAIVHGKPYKAFVMPRG